MSSYIDQLKQALEEEKKMYQLAQAQQEAALNRQKEPVREEAGKLRGDTYQNAQLAAIGNNELLAQKGLAGGLYQAPRSGYSETSRIRQDTALRNALNAADLHEQKQLAAIDEKIRGLGDDTGRQIAAASARWTEKIADATREEELRRLQQEREDQLLRQQQEREDQLRREQWEREDRLRAQQAASARAPQSTRAVGTGASRAADSGYTAAVAEAAQRKLAAQALINRVDSYAQSLGVSRAGTYRQAEEIQRQAWQKALADARQTYGSSATYRTIAQLANAPADLLS